MLRLVSRSRARLPRTLQACLSVRLSTATSDCAAAVGVLTSIAHWRLGEAGLEKNFEFGTRPVAERFCLQALDLRVEQMDRSAEMQAARALRICGWTATYRDDTVPGRPRFYRRRFFL